jgi:hypothetical protein
MVARNVTYANIVENELLKLQTVKWVLYFTVSACCPSLGKRNNRYITPVEYKKLRSDLSNQIVRSVCVVKWGIRVVKWGIHALSHISTQWHVSKYVFLHGISERT